MLKQFASLEQQIYQESQLFKPSLNLMVNMVVPSVNLKVKLLL